MVNEHISPIMPQAPQIYPSDAGVETADAEDGDIERVTGVVIDGETVPADKDTISCLGFVGFRVVRSGLRFRVQGLGLGFGPAGLLPYGYA